MKRITKHIATGRGYRIDVTITLRKESKPLIVFVHGIGVDKYYHIITELDKKFARAGYSSAVFNLAGHGKKQNRLQLRKVPNFVRDVRDVIEVCTKVPERKKRNIILIGHSMGAFATLIATGQRTYVSVHGVVLIGCNADPVEKYIAMKKSGSTYMTAMHTMIGRVRMSKNFWSDRNRYAIRRLMQRIHGRVLVVCGTRDTVNPLAESRQLAQWGGKNATLLSIQGADHHFRNQTHKKKLISAIVNWVERVK